MFSFFEMKISDVHLNLSSKLALRESIVNAPRISCLILTLLRALFVF
jgi:hypothetical protein